MERTNQKIKISQAGIQHLDDLQSLYSDTIDSVCNNEYSPIQRNEWKSGINNKKRWVDAISEQYFLIAELNNNLVGFGSLKDGEYIDFLYVSKNHLRKGIARLLLAELENESKMTNKLELSSDVSLTAKPFFESNGFVVEKKNINIRNGIELINFRMKKRFIYP